MRHQHPSPIQLQTVVKGCGDNELVIDSLHPMTENRASPPHYEPRIKLKR